MDTAELMRIVDVERLGSEVSVIIDPTDITSA